MAGYLWIAGIVAGLFVYCVILGRCLSGHTTREEEYLDWLDNRGQWEEED